MCSPFYDAEKHFSKVYLLSLHRFLLFLWLPEPFTVVQGYAEKSMSQLSEEKEKKAINYNS